MGNVGRAILPAAGFLAGQRRLSLRLGLADPIAVEIRSPAPIRQHIGRDVAIPGAVQQEYCQARHFTPSTDNEARLGSTPPPEGHNDALRKGNRAGLLLVNLPRT